MLKLLLLINAEKLLNFGKVGRLVETWSILK